MLFWSVSLATNPQVTFRNSRWQTEGIFAAVLWELMKALFPLKEKKKTFLCISPFESPLWSQRKNHLRYSWVLCYIHMPVDSSNSISLVKCICCSIDWSECLWIGYNMLQNALNGCSLNKMLPKAMLSSDYYIVFHELTFKLNSLPSLCTGEHLEKIKLQIVTVF